MGGTKDIINELIEAIQSQGYDFVIGIINPKTKSSDEKIEIFTNGTSDGLKKLLFVLKIDQKSVKVVKESRKDLSERNITDI